MAGIYFHIPFCKSKCGYCAFNSRPLQSDEELDNYFKALKKELALYEKTIRGWEIKTIFFGGGTPSCQRPDQVADLVDSILKIAGKKSDELEITLEANPDTFIGDLPKAFFDGGINRLSLGIQSFDKGVLDFLERKHNPDTAENAFLKARDAGLKNISLDFIVGLPQPYQFAYKNDLSKALELSPEHLSVYLLNAEKPSRLYEKVASGAVELPRDDTLANIFLDCHHLLSKGGFNHYEVSNYCLPGFESKHNSSYWHDEPYLGLGAGSHSYIEDGGRYFRRANVPDPDHYVHFIQSDVSAVEFKEEITPKLKFKEKIMLELRMSARIDPADYRPVEKAIKEGLEHFIDRDWIVLKDDGFFPTPEGLLVAEGMCVYVWELMDKYFEKHPD